MRTHTHSLQLAGAGTKHSINIPHGRVGVGADDDIGSDSGSGRLGEKSIGASDIDDKRGKWIEGEHIGGSSEKKILFQPPQYLKLHSSEARSIIVNRRYEHAYRCT